MFKENKNALVSPELQAAFNEWIKRNNIKAAAFDFDDTLLKTHDWFLTHHEQFFSYCKTLIPNLDLNSLREDFRKLNNDLFTTMGVSTKKWGHLVDLFSQKFDTDLSAGKVFLQQMYEGSPDIIEGAKETLQACKTAGLKLGLVTHATNPWTKIKLNEHGLESMFSFVKVIDVDQELYKEPKHWKETADGLNTDPSEIFAVGDNLKGDIISAQQAGYKILFWIPSEWEVYRIGQRSEEVCQISSIANLIPSICQLK